jgi:23S rRNA-/tRNA-specific pseudouridylate synthase
VTKYPTLYKAPDNSFAILDKPFGVSSGDVAEWAWENSTDVFGMPGSAIFQDSGPRPRYVHRLDVSTSGCLIVGFNYPDSVKLRKAFEERKVSKTYFAIVSGTVSRPSGTIDAPLKTIRDRKGPPHTSVAPESEGGLPSTTHFKVLGTDGHQTLLELHPLTGHTHQLRVHCSEILKAPIVNDSLYGDNKAGPLELMCDQPPLCLHAHKISLPDSPFGTVEAQAPLPPYIAERLEGMGLQYSRMRL